MSYPTKFKFISSFHCAWGCLGKIKLFVDKKMLIKTELHFDLFRVEKEIQCRNQYWCRSALSKRTWEREKKCNHGAEIRENHIARLNDQVRNLHENRELSDDQGWRAETLFVQKQPSHHESGVNVQNKPQKDYKLGY